MNDFTIGTEQHDGHGQIGTTFGETFEKELTHLQAEYDLEQLAEECKALVRRREVQNAMDLLRIIMCYSVVDYSLRMVGIWCTVVGIANLSKTALLNRLRNSQMWMGKLVMLALGQQKLLHQGVDKLRVRIIDASVICQLGSRGADWRLHMSFDLMAGCLDEVELTNGSGAERLNRFAFKPGELCIADRAYAVAKSLGWILAQGAWVLVRAGWSRLSYENENGQRFDVVQWLRGTHLERLGAPAEVTVWITCPEGRYALRLLAQAISEEATEKARRKARADAAKNHNTVDERSLFVAGYVLLLTNLPADIWAIDSVIQLYRFRWQIELAFKRMKGLIHLDHLRCKDPELVQVCLFAKLFAVILMERHQLQLTAQQADAFISTDRPISLWRLSALFLDHIRSSVHGQFTLANILEAFPRLTRFLADEPRKRKQQFALAKSLLLAFSPTCASA